MRLVAFFMSCRDLQNGLSLAILAVLVAGIVSVTLPATDRSALDAGATSSSWARASRGERETIFGEIWLRRAALRRRRWNSTESRPHGRILDEKSRFGIGTS